MDSYSYISENGEIRQIIDLESQAKNVEQDARITALENKVIYDIYSTAETKTNKIWLDGKPIYRKVILFNSEREISDGGTNFTLTTLGLSNIDNIFKVYAFNSTGTKSLKRRFCPAGILWTNDTTIQLRICASMQSYYLGLIVEYTKTTD